MEIDTTVTCIPTAEYEQLKDLLQRCFSSFENIMEDFGLSDSELTLMNDIEKIIVK